MKDIQDTGQTPAEALLTLPYPTFLRLGAVPWKPWVMEGVSYKLMSIDPRHGGFTCLLKVEPGVVAPVHQHLGGIEVLVLSGSIYYEEADIGQTGDYIFEPAGDIHRPVSPEGCELFCVFYGPISGLADDGSVAGTVDGKTMMEMAEAHGVAAHVRSV
ncbi:MAG: 2,4'-dihydroxyacetophenone dioxygenase family protein [Pseudomonadota bacterium]